MREVVVDSDAGVDDALAILSLLADPGVRVSAFGSVSGNCAAGQAARNILAVLEAAGLGSPPPVAAGADLQELRDYSRSPHGPDGLGGAGFAPQRLAVSGEGAAGQLLRLSRERGGRLSLLCLGPLTNIAAALEVDPLLLTRFDRVVVMGGMGVEADRDRVLRAYPQFLAKGDTNTNHDPAAAAVVAQAEGNVLWAGMNVTAPLQVPLRLLEDAAAGGHPVARFVLVVTRSYSGYCTAVYQAAEPVFTAHDSVAAAVLAEPGIAVSVRARPRVALDPVDGRASLWGADDGAEGPRHRFVTAVDHPRVLSRILAAISPA